MAGLLSRFTTFLPNTTILSNDHNQELNRIVNLLNGTTTNLKTVLKTSDAGDSPLDVDQLGAGPILRGFQGGILKFTFDNSGNLVINNTNPSITFDDTAGTDSKIHHDASILRLGSTAADQISLDVSTGVATFAAIPVGPASNPTTDNQFARKKYIDDKAAAFTLTWKIDDPSTFPTTSQSALPTIQVAEGGGGFLTRMTIIFRSGSHTAGGTLGLIALLDGTEVSGGEVQFTDTNNTANTFYEANFSDVAIAGNQSITVYIKTRSGTITERDVSINLHGYQKVKSV